MERREFVGNVMSAVRDVQPGEVVLVERPAVFGPDTRSAKAARREGNVCVECLSSKAKEKCPRCGFPACDEKCECVRFQYSALLLRQSYGRSLKVGTVIVSKRERSSAHRDWRKRLPLAMNTIATQLN